MSPIAVTYEPEAYSVDTPTLMGRQSAGAGFLRAFAASRPARTFALSNDKRGADDLKHRLAGLGSPSTAVEWIGIHNVGELCRPGLLYRPDPAIADDAWRRAGRGLPAAWSLCGITHTTAHDSVMSEVAAWLTAPVEPWDAVICTSAAVRSSLVALLERQAAWLAERLGARNFVLPQLPVIPLGVHSADFAIREDERAAARAALGIPPGETVFLFVGRLSAYSKAHPLPLFLALEACAPSGPVTLLQAGWFETGEARAGFEADAATLCPSVRCLYADGREAAERRRAWAAADVFVSFADSIQETFGLTPVEAMAAGLPCVVSDWDGYRETVRDGVDGFRVPTLALPPSAGQPLADRYAAGLDDYHAYCGATGQFVAIDVAAATEACRRLQGDPALRRRMGEAARARARGTFDWGNVFAHYRALWADLAELRRGAPAASAEPRLRPDRPDPFTLFAAYPTAPLAPDTPLKRSPAATAAAAAARRRLATVRFAEPLLPAPDLVARILERLDDSRAMSFEELRAALALPPLALAPAVVWLAKMGLVAFAGPARPDAERLR